MELSVAVGAIDVSMLGEGTRGDGVSVPKGSSNTYNWYCGSICRQCEITNTTEH